MITKELKFKKEAREKLAKGADTLAQAVTSTLGPRSKNVAINRQFPAPLVVHDGVTVAKSIRLKDPFEDMGAVLLKEAASKTNDLAGDGTTTATLIANTLLQDGIKLTESGITDGMVSPKINAMYLKEELDRYAQLIVKKLVKKSKKLKKGDIKRIANISSGNEEIAELVKKAIDKVGAEGLVMVEPSTGFESEVETSEGMEFDNGFLSPYFVTDTNRMIAEYDDAYVLLTDMAIADGMTLVPIIEKVIKDGQNKKALIIIAHDVVGPALQALVLTKLKQGVPLIAVVAPEYAERRKQMLEDIAILTGAKVFSADKQDSIQSANLSDLGKASIRVTQTHTMITPKYPDTEEIKERADAIREQIANEESSFLKERLQYRLAKLTQGVAVIKVGGATEQEIAEKKERVIDAVHAVKAAMSEGIIAGGGVALWDIAEELQEEAKDKDDPILKLVANAIRTPATRLLESLEWDLTKLDLKKDEGIDLITGEQGDMFEMGIIDPVKVTRLAIIHGFSVAGMMITTDVLITEEKETDVQKIKVVNREVNNVQ